MGCSKSSSCRMLGAAALLAVFFVGLSFSQSLGADDEFKALPGLWKTTYSPYAPRANPTVDWHCVFEDSDPWTNFAYSPTPLDKSCKSEYSKRTGTSLKWRLDCKSPSAITSEGSIIFSSADHYTGVVELRGTLMGYPIDQTISVEGKRLAACTSPQD
jgi:hypothetical protein